MFNPSTDNQQDIKFDGGIGEFKDEWKAIGNLAPERFHALKRYNNGIHGSVRKQFHDSFIWS